MTLPGLSLPFLRFATVGLLSNVMLFAAYLTLTTLVGFGHMVAMTVVYVSGVALTFVANRSWTFREQESASGSFVRYLLAYFLGYAVNVALLWLAVDLLGAPHQFTQAFAILVVAVCMFLLQRHWVFAVAKPELPQKSLDR